MTYNYDIQQLDTLNINIKYNEVLFCSCLLLVSSRFEDDDLSQERCSWQEQSWTQENNGEKEMFHSQRLRRFLFMFFGEIHFNHQQSSLEYQTDTDMHILR